MLNFSKSEIDTLVELVYLGNWLTSSAMRSKCDSEKYNELFLKISGACNLEEEEIYCRLQWIIERYNNSILFSEFAKQYADHKYPIDLVAVKKGDQGALMQYAGNCVFKIACEKELETNGLKCVSVALPDLSDEIKERYNSLKV